jgi:hypothetical protein
MPIVTVFYDNISFAQANNVADDFEMTIPSADGWYSEGNIYRYATGGVLGPVQDCDDCNIPSVPCGRALATGGGEQGQYHITVDAGTDIGAVVIKFNPADIPDKCTWIYDGLVASEYSSLGAGYLQGVIGLISSGQTCGSYIPPGTAGGNPWNFPIDNLFGSNNAVYSSPTSNDGNPAADTTPVIPDSYIWQWDGTDFVNTNAVVVMGPYGPASPPLGSGIGGVTLTNPSPGECFMVIPKPNAGPESFSLIIDGPCGNTGWNMEIYCPRALQSFSVGAAGGVCGLSGTDMYYCSVDPASDGTATVIGLHDWVFQDANGVAAFPAGMYPVTMGGVDYCITVSDDGIVTAIAVCAGTCV